MIFADSSQARCACRGPAVVARYRVKSLLLFGLMGLGTQKANASVDETLMERCDERLIAKLSNGSQCHAEWPIYKDCQTADCRPKPSPRFGDAATRTCLGGARWARLRASVVSKKSSLRRPLVCTRFACWLSPTLLKAAGGEGRARADMPRCSRAKPGPRLRSHVQHVGRPSCS